MATQTTWNVYEPTSGLTTVTADRCNIEAEGKLIRFYNIGSMSSENVVAIYVVVPGLRVYPKEN